MIDFIINELKSVSNPSSIHGIYPYRGKISAIDAQQILDQIPEGATLLDPFCGSGTIIYEGLKRNINSIGLDLNPIACFLSAAKVDLSHNISLEEILNELNSLIEKSKNNVEDFSNKESAFYFHKDSHNEICRMAVFFNEMSPYLKAVFMGSVALTARGCNHYKWTSSTVGKNIEPKNYINFYEKFLQKAKKHYYPLNSNAEGRIIKCDAREISKSIKPESIDFVFSSPPYFDCLDYTSYYAKIIYSILDINRLEIRSDLIQTLKTYKEDMKIVLDEIYKVCKPGAQVIFVVGDKKIKGEVINGANFLNEVSPFNDCKIIERNYSGTSSKVFDSINKTERKEQIIIWTK